MIFHPEVLQIKKSGDCSPLCQLRLALAPHNGTITRIRNKHMLSGKLSSIIQAVLILRMIKGSA